MLLPDTRLAVRCLIVGWILPPRSDRLLYDVLEGEAEWIESAAISSNTARDTQVSLA